MSFVVEDITQRQTITIDLEKEQLSEPEELQSDDECTVIGGSKSRPESETANKRFRMQKFRDSWKSEPAFKEWLSYSKVDQSAFCMWCNQKLQPKRSSLLDHIKSSRHSKSKSTVKTCQDLSKTYTRDTLQDQGADMKVFFLKIIGMIFIRN